MPQVSSPRNLAEEVERREREIGEDLHEDRREHVASEAGPFAEHAAAFQRPPTADETKLALDYIKQQNERTGGKPSMDAWEKFAQALLQTNELIYVN